MALIISSLRENTDLRKWGNGVSVWPSSSFLSSKSPAANIRKRMRRRLSSREMSLFLKTSSLLPGTGLTVPEEW